MDKVKKWFGRILSVMLYVALISMVLLVIISRASGGTPTILGYQLKTVLSGSMEPSIETGSIIAIQTAGDMTNLQVGDVITYQTRDGFLVTHRIEEVMHEGSQYITKGDANDGADLSPILAENVVGVYTGFTIPYLGYVMTFAQSKAGNLFLLILPGLLLIGYSVMTIMRALKELDQMHKEKESSEAGA